MHIEFTLGTLESQSGPSCKFRSQLNLFHLPGALCEMCQTFACWGTRSWPPNTPIQTLPVIKFSRQHLRLKATSKVDPSTRPSHPSLSSPHLTTKWIQRHGCWKCRRWPQAPSDFNPLPLPLSVTPLVVWELSHRKQHWKYSHIPLLLLLYILCNEECTPTAIVAKILSRLLFPACICSLQHWSQIEASSSLGTDWPSWQTHRGGEKEA